MTSIPGFIALF